MEILWETIGDVMIRQIGVQRQIVLLLLVGLLSAAMPALAQQEETQQPTPVPSDPQTANEKDGRNTDPERQSGRANWKEKQERLTIASSRFCLTTAPSKTPSTFHLSPRDRNSDWLPLAYSIGGRTRSTASLLE